MVIVIYLIIICSIFKFNLFLINSDSKFLQQAFFEYLIVLMGMNLLGHIFILNSLLQVSYFECNQNIRWQDIILLLIYFLDKIKSSLCTFQLMIDLLFGRFI
jgi:hypothetical protein